MDFDLFYVWQENIFKALEQLGRGTQLWPNSTISNGLLADNA